MSKIFGLSAALSLLLLCTLHPPVHAGALPLRSGMGRMVLDPGYRGMVLDFVSARTVKFIGVGAQCLEPPRVQDLFGEERKSSPRPSGMGFDKVLHFTFSATLVGIAYHGSRVALEKDHRASQWMAGMGTGLLGIVKEGRDSRVSMGDLLADALGIATGIALFTAR
ncbi:MAG: hypothetical protein V1800_15030 [Candidatus Latescibacterota bacterium]